MPRRAAGLLALDIKRKPPGRYGDGGGLYLLVRDAEARFWLFRYSMPGGKQREMGLGPALGRAALSLSEARDRAGELLKLVRSGVDPLDQRQATAKAVARTAIATRTFDAVAKLYMDAHEAGWSNSKHRAQWTMTLDTYAGPHLGKVAVDAVETGHVTAALQPLWNIKPETAGRLRGRIEAVLNYAAAKGWRTGLNPARWRGHLDQLFPSPRKIASVEHHAALPWQEVGLFMAALRAQDVVSARALEFAILTAARSGEVLDATWGEIELKAGLWTVPAVRMKAKREHRVPLSAPALALLNAMATVRASAEPEAPIFPGNGRGVGLSGMALLMLLRRMNAVTDDGKPRWRDGVSGEAITAHGFRSSFRDWAGETTAHPREVVEAALAHSLKNKAEAAYARGDLFVKRRALMEEWATFCGKAPAEVLHLDAKRAARTEAAI